MMSSQFFHIFCQARTCVLDLEKAVPSSSMKLHVQYNFSAPLWNKPKVEEILTIHNMPEGIPLDFLKTIIPDAITVEMEDKNQKFTQKGR